MDDFSSDTINLAAQFGGGSTVDVLPVGTPVANPWPPQPQPTPTAAAAPSTPGTMEQPGTYESYWASVSPQFQQPWAAETSLPETQQGYRDLMETPGPTFSADAYGAFGGGVPANLDPYFDRAWETGSNRLNNQFAARGGFNSSAATNQLSDLAGNLGAMQAREEGQYNLDRARTGGALASSASGEATSNLGRQESLLGDIFGAGESADRMKAARLGLGMGGAETAQNMQEGRVQQDLDNRFRLSGMLADVFSGGTAEAIAADMEAQGVPHELAMAFAKMQMDAEAAQGKALQGAIGTGVNAVSAANGG